METFRRWRTKQEGKLGYILLWARAPDRLKAPVCFHFSTRLRLSCSREEEKPRTEQESARPGANEAALSPLITAGASKS